MKKKVLTTTLLLISLFINLQILAQCPLNDWTALKALYESTGGDNWKDNSGWETVKENMPPEQCDLNILNGIKLDMSGRVSHLDLVDNNLAGSIPNELSSLSNLESLDLSRNQLNGNIPAEIGKLSNLKKLFLPYNQLSGSIPKELGNLNNLIRLSLSQNELDGSIPDELSKLNNLKWLFLSKNQLSGSIPTKLCNLNKLEELSLPMNKLSGGIPSEIAKLSNLESLALSSNQLSGNIPSELGELSNLKYLVLSSNQFSGNIPSELGKLSNLTYLWLSSNQLTGGIPVELTNLTNLIDLRLQSNQLNGTIPAGLANLSSLENLYLHSNQLNGTIPSGLGDLINLTNFYLDENQITGVIPSFNQDKINLSFAENHFSCSEIEKNFENNRNLMLSYQPQNYTPLNYNEIKSNVFDALDTEQSLRLEIDFPFDTNGYTYQWLRNGDIIPGADKPTYIIETVQRKNAGIYTLNLRSENCLHSEFVYEAVSAPIYVILKGYDLLGQPIEYTQLMIEYENKEDKYIYEDEIITRYGGMLIDKCDCNRELHLYNFPDDSSSLEQAYITLDKKIKRTKARSKIDGGFNYKLNNFGLNSISSKMATYSNQLTEDNKAYSVQYNYPDGDYSDDVNVYLLDSGLDKNNFKGANEFLLANAPVDSCYNISAPGYNFAKIINYLNEFTETIDTNYQDQEGHGTFGFRSIIEGLQGAGNVKIIPLKIIERATDGSLFDLICAMYHAVDHNADVINISAGYRGEPSSILADAIYYARGKGIFVVASAGNDGLDIDQVEVPQYPAYYASQYHYIYSENGFGELKMDSVPYDNLITVAAVNVNNQLNVHSNYGVHSATIAAPGENIYGHGLKGVDAVGTGTSIAAFLTTQVLAHEIARDNNRTLEEIWIDFESRYLTYNPALADNTSTGKQINFNWEVTQIQGCTDCSACNYFPYATIEDGSCYYCVDDAEVIIPLACPSDSNCPPCSPKEGCTDANACNYLPLATIDDGSCMYEFPQATNIINPGVFSLQVGEGIVLMDLVTDNSNGYWSGENVIHLMQANGVNIPYFSTNVTGVYKLYYTVQNNYCDHSYLLIVNVFKTKPANTKAVDLIKEVYRINGSKIQEDFIIYPNPANGKIFIELVGDIQSSNTLTVFDCTGKAILQSSFEGKHYSVDLNNLAQGVYMVMVENLKQQSTQKLLID